MRRAVHSMNWLANNREWVQFKQLVTPISAVYHVYLPYHCKVLYLFIDKVEDLLIEYTCLGVLN